jgi:hypothetical protein
MNQFSKKCKIAAIKGNYSMNLKKIIKKMILNKTQTIVPIKAQKVKNLNNKFKKKFKLSLKISRKKMLKKFKG